MGRSILIAKKEVAVEEVRKVIRDVPDFPKPGIIFKDLTPVLADAQLIRQITEHLAAPYKNEAITAVAGNWYFCGVSIGNSGNNVAIRCDGAPDILSHFHPAWTPRGSSRRAIPSPRRRSRWRPCC